MTDLRLPQERVVATRASVWKRVAAFVLDLLLIDLLLFPPFRRFVALDPVSWQEALQQQVVLPAGFVLATVAMGLLALLYLTLFEYYFGQTIGMRLLGIVVVGGDRSWWRCALRNAFALPFFPFTLFWVVDPLYLFWRKERLLERWSGTSTVELMRM